MMIHHVVTIGLLAFSWVLNFVRIGSLVLVIRDAADSWLSVSYSNLLSLHYVLLLLTARNKEFAVSCIIIKHGQNSLAKDNHHAQLHN